MNKDTTIQIRITKEMKEKLQKMALEDQRTLADYIRIQLVKVISESEKKK